MASAKMSAVTSAPLPGMRLRRARFHFVLRTCGRFGAGRRRKAGVRGVRFMGREDNVRGRGLKPLHGVRNRLRSCLMERKPRLISQTVYTERGLQLPPIPGLRHARWPWAVLAASPFVGVGIAALWHGLGL